MSAITTNNLFFLIFLYFLRGGGGFCNLHTPVSFDSFEAMTSPSSYSCSERFEPKFIDNFFKRVSPQDYQAADIAIKQKRKFSIVLNASKIKIPPSYELYPGKRLVIAISYLIVINSFRSLFQNPCLEIVIHHIVQ